MIIVMNQGCTKEEIREIIEHVESKGVKTNISKGDSKCIIGLIGDTTVIDPGEILSYRYVDRILKVQEPFKKANRLFKPEDTIVDVLGSKVGGTNLGIMAGPCSVESEEQIIEIAKSVKLCERGIRTFETYTRNTLDLSAVPVVKRLSHLPVIVDPSHASGDWRLVEPMAKAAILAGCDGLMIEVHNNPQQALCDGKQSIKPSKFDSLMKSVKVLAQLEGKTI